MAPCHLVGTVAEHGLGPLVEEDDLALLVGGYDCVGRAFDQPGEIAFGVLQCAVGLESRLLGALAFGDFGPGSDQFARKTILPIDDSEAVLDPNVMAIVVTKPVFQ